MCKLEKTCLYLALFFTAFKAKAEPQIFNFYPSCEYTVLETVSVTKDVMSINGTILNHHQFQTTDEILDEIRALGVEKEAFGILLVGRELNRKAPAKTGRRSIRHTISLEAELISDCEGEFTLSENSTPYTPKGEKRIDLGVFSTYEHEVRIERENQKRQEAANNNINIEPDKIFGLELGASKENIETLLGYPSVVFRLDNNKEILGFGRQTWVLLSNNKLVGITSRNRWFSQEFINMIPYRPKYDEMTWTLPNKISRNGPIPNDKRDQGARNGNEISYVFDTANLTVILDDVTRTKASGFTLLKNGIEELAFANYKVQYNQAFDINWTQLKSDTSNFDINSLGAPKAKVLSESKEDIYVYSPHIYATIKHGKVSQISATESLFKTPTLTQTGWKLDQYYAGQNWQDVVKTLPDDRVEMVGKILVTDSNLSSRFLFYEENNNEILYEVHYFLH